MEDKTAIYLANRIKHFLKNLENEGHAWTEIYSVYLTISAEIMAKESDSFASLDGLITLIGNAAKECPYMKGKD